MSDSTFMSALLDPGVNALFGAAQGFANAAMPTRVPTPFGAVLGMGAGGLQQGVQNAQQMQLGQQNVQRAQMQNKLTSAQLPMELAKTSYLSNLWQHPDQLQQMMNPGAAAPFGAPAASASPTAPAAPAPISGGGAAAASNPSIQPLISAAAAKYGIPEPLATAYLQQESSLGTNPAAKGNIGQITFKTANNPGYGMQPLSGTDLADPAKNIDFSLQYLRKAGDAAGVKDWNDPSQWGIGLKAYNGGGDPNYVQNVARFLPKSTMIPGGVTQGSFQVAQAGNGAVPVPGGGSAVAAQPQGGAAAQPQQPAPQGAPAVAAQPQMAPGAPLIAGGQTPSPQGGAAQFTGPNAGSNAMLMYQKYEAMAQQATQQQLSVKWAMDNGIPPIGYRPIGDPATLHATAQKFLELALAGPTTAAQKQAELQTAGPIAAATSQAELPAQLAKTGFRMTANGGMEPIPGGVADPQYVGAAKAAEAQAQLPAQLAQAGFQFDKTGNLQPIPGGKADPTYISKEAFAKLPNLRPGSMLVVPQGVSPEMPGGGFLKNPELREVTDPATGQKSYVHINPASPFAPPGTAGEASPVNMASGSGNAPAVAGVAPQIAQAREDAVKEFMGKDSDAYQAAQNTQAWLHQIDHAADTMSQAGPLYMTGPHAEVRLGVMSNINDMARTLGIKAPFDQNAVASWEEMKKATTTAGFELSSHYEGHARQAAATIMNATSAVPAQSNSPVGQKLVSAGIREGAQSAIDLHNYRQQMLNETQGGDKFVSAENDFYQAHPAEQYAQRAISTVHPVKITDPAQFSKYLPGTYALLPNGKLVQVPARPGAPPIPAYLQQAPQQ